MALSPAFFSPNSSHHSLPFPFPCNSNKTHTPFSLSISISISISLHNRNNARVYSPIFTTLKSTTTTTTTDEKIESFLDSLRRHEIPTAGLLPSKLHRLYPQHLSVIKTRLLLLTDHGIPKDKLAHILNNVNVRKVFCEMPLRDLEEMILFLKRFGWPGLILRRPVLLNLDLRAQLVPRVNFLMGLADGDENSTALLIGKLPAILAYSVEHCESHLDFWTAVVGLTKEQVFKIALVYPNVFSVSRERKLKPRIEFLVQCGFDAEEIFKFLIKAPLFLSLSYEDNLSKKLGFLVKVGYRHRTKEMAVAVGATTRTSCENMQKVIGLFLNYGFSFEDVLIMSRKHPQILQYKYESLEKKMEFLIEGMERDIGELMAFPAFLGYKLDDRIKRRYEMKKEIQGKGMSLNKLLSVSTKKFNLKMGSTSSDGESDCNSDLEKG